MAEFSEYPAGTFCWVDLVTTDAGSAKKFYSELFGWSLIDMPVGEGMFYTMAQVGGKNVAALYQQGPEQEGMPPFWSSYVSVTKVDASTAKATELGGTVLMEPMDVMDAGRMAMIQDPTGATFGLWQPGQHHGADLANLPGAFSWNELATKDPRTARDFYTGLFGWTVQTQDMGHMVYTSFLNGGRMNAGMIQMNEEWGDMPPHWTVYFAVEDCDASVAKVKELGGNVGVDPFDIPEVGRAAVVSDPQGAHFTVIKVINPL